MSDLAIDQVLSQIRTLAGQAGPAFRPAAQTVSDLQGLASAAGAPATGGAGNDVGAVPFAQLLRSGIDAVNSSQQRADALSSAWERGDPGVNLAQVMVQMEKASVSLQALTQVRNRLISAYQDIMNMSI